MFAFFTACTSGFARTTDCPGGGNLLGAGKNPSVLATRRLLLADVEGADDDEDAAMEGWLKKNSSLTRWLWHSRFFRLEQGPRLLSFYRSQIWQGCRRDGAFDLTRLVGVYIMPQWGGRNTHLVLEFSQTSAEIPSGSEPVETIRLRVPSGLDAAREWEQRLLESIEGQLLEACEQCVASELAADRAVQILSRAHFAAAEGRTSANVDRRRQQGSEHTALMLTAQAGHERLCTMLLLGKADPGLTDLAGRSALQLAESAGHAKVVALFAEGLQDQGVPAPFPDAQQTVLGRARAAEDNVLIKAAQLVDRLPTPARV